MPKRKPRLVGKRKSEETHNYAAFVARESAKRYVPPVKTERERVFDIIYDACRKGYHFTDRYYGIPFIELGDVEEKEGGIYIVRFRSEPKYLHDVYFGRMAKDVCEALRSGMHFVHERKQEWGIPFEECVWVLQKGEIPEPVPFYKEFYTTMSEINTEQENTSEKKTKPSPKKCTHERWNEFLGEKYGRTLLDVASELGYSDENLEILACDKGDVNAKRALYKTHKALFDAFLNTDCAALRDGRNPLDYFKDLIASWIGEDLLVRALNEYGFKAEVANADKDRKIKTTRSQITCAADIKIEYEGNVRYLELMDALSPVAEYGQFELRLEKAKKQFEYGNLFLLQCLTDGKFVLIDFMRDSIAVKYNAPHPRWGGKISSSVVLEDNGISLHPMALLWETLKGVMVNTKPAQEHTLKLIDFATGKEEVLVADAEDSEASESIEEEDAQEYEEPVEKTSEQKETVSSEEQEPVVSQSDTIEQPLAQETAEQTIVIEQKDEETDLSEVSDESEEQSLEVTASETEEEPMPPPIVDEEPEEEENEGFLGVGLGDLSEYM